MAAKNTITVEITRCTRCDLLRNTGDQWRTMYCGHPTKGHCWDDHIPAHNDKPAMGHHYDTYPIPDWCPRLKEQQGDAND